MPTIQGRITSDATRRYARSSKRTFYLFTVNDEVSQRQTDNTTSITACAFVDEGSAGLLRTGALVEMSGKLRANPGKTTDGADKVDLVLLTGKLEVIEEAPRPVEPISLQAFYDKLESFDWYYSFSEDPRVYQRGTEGVYSLQLLAKQSEAHAALFKAYQAFCFSGESWKTPQAPKPERPA